MVVNWKAPDANDRLMGALLAAHTEFKPDYNKIAKVFGRGATYNSVEGQFRKYREMAKKLASGAPDGESTQSKSSTPRVPRTPRSSQTNGITKSTGSGKRGGSVVKKDKVLKSPTKAGKSGKSEALINAIRLSDTESDGDARSIKSETVVCEDKMAGVKVEHEKMGVPVDFGPALTSGNSQTNGYVQAQEEDDDDDDDDVFGPDA
ncbi:uncharacterized protein TRUGW13939_09584 [Talaromyces rugulosus]|uniref:Myb-like domain-containing protein n=1 Tax=Talaromyces rugulosus TaxID=121627 RepID=A0A7H8RCZ1_TALRU|nr:uncharacterized protein TRUGW13939_09584 [Talaromyces rugulosus]QKX62423.1 hypothetical protein TRUGW13939_09584 [Talaromyces rugulosus]